MRGHWIIETISTDWYSYSNTELQSVCSISASCTHTVPANNVLCYTCSSIETRVISYCTCVRCVFVYTTLSIFTVIHLLGTFMWLKTSQKLTANGGNCCHCRKWVEVLSTVAIVRHIIRTWRIGSIIPSWNNELIVFTIEWPDLAATRCSGCVASNNSRYTDAERQCGGCHRTRR